MLSFNAYGNGKPISIIKGGKYNNKIIYLEEDTPDNAQNIINNNPLDMVNEEFIRNLKKKLNAEELRDLTHSLRSGISPHSEILKGIVNTILQESKRKSLKEFKIYDEGVIQPLPNFNKTERCYIAGPTECGKSYVCKKYMEQLTKVHPDMPIYLFSDVEEDPEIDSINNLKRIPLTEDMIENPPPTTKFKDSICIFDDIDSIQNRKLYKVIQGLRDSLLRRGRHDNISTLITSHLMSNYKDTRIILNECNSITFFPRSGASDAIKYTLQKYAGMGKKAVSKTINLPSRWVMVYKSYPSYVMYEKGVYIL